MMLKISTTNTCFIQVFITIISLGSYMKLFGGISYVKFKKLICFLSKLVDLNLFLLIWSCSTYSLVLVLSEPWFFSKLYLQKLLLFCRQILFLVSACSDVFQLNLWLKIYLKLILICKTASFETSFVITKQSLYQKHTLLRCLSKKQFWCR